MDMSYGDLAPQICPHCVTIEERHRIRITGVVDVESFQEEEAAIRVQDGLLYLSGEGMKLTRLDPDSHTALIDGTLISLEYACEREHRRGLFARLRG